jgi:L-ascorbate metabolism protein UlaG (beta-lactamase superfamily)
MVRLLLLVWLLAPIGAEACGAIADAAPHVMRAALGPAETDGIAVTFLGHASFLIETPRGVTAVTDYNGVNIPDAPPDIATMNHAHSTHYTDSPDPRIAHVLHGWRDDGGPAHIDLTLGDLRVSNLPTSTRDFFGGPDRTYGNSIFVFESAGLCIAHLSHLHHLLTPDDLAALGPIDVVMAPVDGTWTLSHADLLTVLDALHPAIVIPMHYFSRSLLASFIAASGPRYTVVENATPRVVLARARLPVAPELLILPGLRNY